MSAKLKSFLISRLGEKAGAIVDAALAEILLSGQLKGSDISKLEKEIRLKMKLCKTADPKKECNSLPVSTQEAALIEPPCDLWALIGRYENFKSQKEAENRNLKVKQLKDIYSSDLSSQCLEKSKRRSQNLIEKEADRLRLQSATASYCHDEQKRAKIAQNGKLLLFECSKTAEAEILKKKQKANEQMLLDRQLVNQNLQEYQNGIKHDKTRKYHAANLMAAEAKAIAIEIDKMKKNRKLINDQETQRVAQEQAFQLDRAEKIRASEIEKRQKRLLAISLSMGRTLGDAAAERLKNEEMRLEKELALREERDAKCDTERVVLKVQQKNDLVKTLAEQIARKHTEKVEAGMIRKSDSEAVKQQHAAYIEGEKVQSIRKKEKRADIDKELRKSIDEHLGHRLHSNTANGMQLKREIDLNKKLLLDMHKDGFEPNKVVRMLCYSP